MILHIFKKDVRRLWPHVLVVLVLVGTLARQDRWRSDRVPGSIEGWLNLLVPLAWVCLTALAIGQEPLVGDREFWITRPYRRRALLAAKALFVLAFIHAPSLVANAYVLTARGFSPLEHLPQLLWQQAVFAAALTLPAAALASLIRNFTHFILELVPVAAALIFLSGILERYPLPFWEPVDAVRHGFAIAVAGAVALAILGLQYINRRTLFARILGGTSAVVALVLFSWLLPQTAFAVRSAMAPAQASPELRIASHAGKPGSWFGSQQNRVTIAIPVEISGIPEGQEARIVTLAAEMTGPAGERYRAPAPMRASPRQISGPFFVLGISPYERRAGERQTLVAQIDRQTYNRLRAGRVRLTGQFGVTFYRLGDPVWMSTGERRQAPGIGLCSANVVDDMWERELLKVECETASHPPLGTRVRLWHPETGKDWHERFFSSSTHFPGPRLTWLSPIERRQAFFHIADPLEPPARLGVYRVPAAVIATARIALTPEYLTGYAVMQYDLQDLALDRYELPQVNR